MIIEGKVKIEGYPTIYDLDNGDVFKFLDENRIYMKGNSNDWVCFIDLDDGSIYNENNPDTNEDFIKPVKKICAVLNVNDN